MKEAENLWKAAFDAISDEVCIIDENGGVRACNRVAEKNIGIAAEKLAGQEICEYVHGSEGHLPDCPFRRMKKTLKREELEIMAGGKWLWVCVDPIFGKDGKLSGAVHVIKDITQHKKEETKKTIRVIKESEEKHLSALGVLAGMLAHDLRNPLGVMKVAAYNIKLKCRNSPVLVDTHIDSIDKKIAESESIIRNLLRYARIKTPQYERVNILALLKECMGHDRDADVRVELVNGTRQKEVICEADPEQLKEVFTNIIDNAFQALSSKKGTIDIRVENDQLDPGVVKISFKDDGIGIEEKDLPKIFMPFFTKKAKGAGIGLAICEQIVRLHGGTITAESKKGRGMTMTVTLPSFPQSRS